MTQYNATYDPGELAGAINDSPDVNYYIMGYAGITLLLVFLGFVRSTEGLREMGRERGGRESTV